MSAFVVIQIWFKTSIGELRNSVLDWVVYGLWQSDFPPEKARRMDAKQAQLEKKLEDLLNEAADVSAQLQAIEQGPGVPHYDQIEGSAHALGQRLSRLAQINRTREVTAEVPPTLNCPDCGKPCPVETANREVNSVDGRLELIENVAHCRRCRRSFFPSA